MATQPKQKKTNYNLSIRSNELIQNSRYLLSKHEEDIITFLTSLIKTTDANFTELEFYIPDFCCACGIDPTSGKNYETVKKALEKLQSRVIWLDFIDEDGNEAEKAINWTSQIIMVKGTNRVKVKFHDDLKDYLLQQDKNFTKIQRIFLLHLRNEYAKRLYLFAKSIHYRKTVQYTKYIPLDELKRRMGAITLSNKGEVEDNLFETWQRFKVRCLDRAISEIDAKTDINISYKKVIEGRKVVGVELTIEEKSACDRIAVEITLQNDQRQLEE